LPELFHETVKVGVPFLGTLGTNGLTFFLPPAPPIRTFDIRRRL